MGSRLERNSSDVRKRIQTHQFTNEDGEEYSASTFGGFGDYMRRKKIKLQNRDTALRENSQGNPQIFKNIVAHVNGYTQPSMNDLHHMIVTHGGGYLQYLDGKTSVTHVIASQLTPKKKVEFRRYRVVKPAWVVDSIAAGKMLPWDLYRLMDEGPAQKTLAFSSGGLTASNTSKHSESSYKNESDSGWYAEQLKNAMSSDSNHGPLEDVLPILNAGDPDPPVDPEIGYLRSALQISQSDATSFNQAMGKPSPSQPVNNSQSAASTTDELMSENESTLLHDTNTPKLPKYPERLEHPVSTPEDAISKLEPSTNVLKDSAAPTSASTPLSINQTISPTFSPAENPQKAIQPVAQSAVYAQEPAMAKRVLTAEEHNAVLLQNPHLAKSSTANPDFIDQYYRESRLHHLSTWKAQLKATLMARGMNINPQRKISPAKSGTRRYILHVDFDSFFVAVSLKNHPHLHDRPVAIAHGNGKGSEIASCNYPARAHGVKNGMWMIKARELCHDLKVLPYDFPAYESASRMFYEVILALDAVVQSISVDEALVDISELCIRAGGSDGKQNTENTIDREQAKASEIAQNVRDAVRDKTGCEVSIGIGGNILLAKVALRAAKPAGQFFLSPDRIQEHIGSLAVQDLPGIGWSQQNKLEGLKIKLVRHILDVPKEQLITHLGPKTGQKLWDYARGIDNQEVGVQSERKSVSCEINWGIRFTEQGQAEEFIQRLCTELSQRLLDNLLKGRHVTLKIMRRAADAPIDPPKNLGHGKCDTFNRSVVLGRATADAGVIATQANAMLRSLAFSPGELRGIGVMITKLEPINSTHFQTNQSLVDGSQRKLQFAKPPVSASNMKDVPSTERSKHDHGDYKDREIVDATKGTSPIPDTKLELRESLDLPPIPGTQIMVPSQVDPSVIAELPPAMRAQILGRSASPQLLQDAIDSDLLAELPDDIRKEIQTERARGKVQRHRGKQQQLLPQSPRKAPPLPPTKSSTTVAGTVSSRRLFVRPSTKGTHKIDQARPERGLQDEHEDVAAHGFTSESESEMSISSGRRIDFAQAGRWQPQNEGLKEHLHDARRSTDQQYLSEVDQVGDTLSDPELTDEVSETGDSRWPLYDWSSDSDSSDVGSRMEEDGIAAYESYLDWLELHEEKMRQEEEEAEVRRQEEEIIRQSRAVRGDVEIELETDTDATENAGAEEGLNPYLGNTEAEQYRRALEIQQAPTKVSMGPRKPLWRLPRAFWSERKLSNTRDICTFLAAWLRKCLPEDADDPQENDIQELTKYLDLVIVHECNLLKAQMILESLAFCCNRSFVYPNEDKQRSFKRVWTGLKDSVQATVARLGFPPLHIGIEV